MKVLDIFSWLPAKEISLEQLERIFTLNNVSEDILTCKNELLKEGKKATFILKEEKVIAVIGYQE